MSNLPAVKIFDSLQDFVEYSETCLLAYFALGAAQYVVLERIGTGIAINDVQLLLTFGTYSLFCL